MQYVITGAAGNISGPLTLSLLKAGHQVTVIGRNAANLTALTDAGATAAIGSLEDAAFVTQAFKNADAVYTMVPPMWQAEDWKSAIAAIGNNLVEAVKQSGVKYVVNLSSVGAHLADGVGPVNGLHRVEQAFSKLENVNIKHLRPSYFYNNLFSQVNLIKQLGFMGTNFSIGEGKFPIVSPSDITDVALEELLQLSFTGHSFRYIASDEVSTDAIAKEIGKAIGKEDLAWVLFSDAQTEEGMLQAGLHPEIAKNYTEMGNALNSGIMLEDYFKQKPVTLGKVKLNQFAQTFANVYNG